MIYWYDIDWYDIDVLRFLLSLLLTINYPFIINYADDGFIKMVNKCLARTKKNMIENSKVNSLTGLIVKMEGSQMVFIWFLI